MVDGQVKAISLQGMVHNATKIGVQDGQCEDLVNLRFKDGAWRSTGDGKYVLSISQADGEEYEQLFIHTNVYRHLLGVIADKDESGEKLKTGTLCWFANLEPKGDDASIDEEDFVFKPLLDDSGNPTHKELTRVTGDITITQTGHLITVIDEANNFDYSLFKSVDNDYKYLQFNNTNDPSSFGSFPYVGLKFAKRYRNGINRTYENNDRSLGEALITNIGEASEDNKFSGHMLAVAAIELYDGSYAFASNPIFIKHNGFTNNISSKIATLQTYDLLFRLSDISNIVENKDVFSSFCIFVTPQTHGYELNIEKLSPDEKKEGERASLPEMSDDHIIEFLMSSNFFLLKRYEVVDLVNTNDFITVELNRLSEAGVVKNIVDQKEIDAEAFDRYTIIPKVSYLYNGRLHIANYTKTPFPGYSIFDLCFQCRNVNGAQSYGDIDSLKQYYSPYGSYSFYSQEYYPNSLSRQLSDIVGYTYTEIETDNGTQTVMSYIPKTLYRHNEFDYISEICPLVTYPDIRAKKMDIVVYVEDAEQDEEPCVPNVFHYEIELKKHTLYNFAYCFNTLSSLDSNKKNVKKIYNDGDDLSGILSYGRPQPNFEAEETTNGLKVSKTDNPMSFPYENTYQVGSSEIVAMCSNAIAVGTGQTGQAPLYVFCKDGIYALMVDASGQMTYTNARVIARDVCNNAKSVTPIDEGVLFTTDRGLMMIAGDQVQEIGQPLEGDISNISHAHVRPMYEAQKLAGLPDDSKEEVSFLEYLKGSIVNYNHNEREVMVSNPDYNYTYILDRDGNWSRRDYTADEYVNNYPTSYRVKDGEFYQVDKESDKENGIFALSNVIKLESIGFKELHRVVVRGYFEVEDEAYLRILVQGSYDGRKWATLGRNTRQGKFRDIGCLVERTDCRFFRIALAGDISKATRIDYIEVSSKNSPLGTKIR